MAASAPSIMAVLGLDTSGFDRGIRRAIGAASSAGRTITASFSSAIKLGGGLSVAAAGFTYLASETEKFNNQMSLARTLSRELSEKQFKSLSVAVERLSVDMGMDATNSALALTEALSSSMPVGLATDYLEKVGKAAVSSASTMQEAQNVFSVIINNYKEKQEEIRLSWKDTARISDILFGVINKGAVSMGQLSRDIGDVVPLAAELGVAFEDIGAAIATVTALRGATSMPEVATGLKNLIMKVLDQNKETEQAITTVNDLLASMGQSLRLQFNPRALREMGLANFVDHIKEVQEAVGQVNLPVDVLFGDVRGLLAMMQLAGTGAQNFAEFLEYLKSNAGETSEAFKIMQNRMLQIKQLMAGFSMVLRDFSHSMSTFLLKFIELQFNIKFGDIGGTISKQFKTASINMRTAIVEGLLGVYDFTKKTLLNLASMIDSFVNYVIAAFNKLQKSIANSPAAAFLGFKSDAKPMENINLVKQVEAYFSGIEQKKTKEQASVIQTLFGNIIASLKSTLSELREEQEAFDRPFQADVPGEPASSEVTTFAGVSAPPTAQTAFSPPPIDMWTDFQSKILEVSATFNQESQKWEIRAEDIAASFQAKVVDTFVSAYQTMTSGISNALTSLITGMGSAEDALKNMFASILNMFIEMMVKMALQTIISSTTVGMANAIAAHSGIPFVGLVIGLAAAGAIAAAIAATAGSGKKAGAKADVGRVPSMDVGGIIPGRMGEPVPMIGHGGELVLNSGQQARLLDNIANDRIGPSQRPRRQPASNVTINIHAVDARGVRDLVYSHDFQYSLSEAIERGTPVRASVRKASRGA